MRQILLQHKKHFVIVLLSKMLKIQPIQFFNIEHRPRLSNAIDSEFLDEFLYRKQLTFIAGIPAKERNKIDNGLFEIALRPVLLDRHITLAFAELALVRIQQEREMGVHRNVPSEITIEDDVFRGTWEPFLSPDDMADPHQVVIHDDSEMIRGESVRFQNHLVVKHFVCDRHLSADRVVKRHLPGERHFHTNDGGLSGCFSSLDL